MTDISQLTKSDVVQHFLTSDDDGLRDVGRELAKRWEDSGNSPKNGRIPQKIVLDEDLEPEQTPVLSSGVILSLFPGIGLLDKAFEDAGFCVVRGPDTLWGGDIRQFNPPPGLFWGIIGGPPCQDFSGLRRTPPTGYGRAMLDQFVRVTNQAKPEWWLLENVARVPNVSCAGYVTQRFDINQGWYCDVSRLRHIQFGSQSGRLLNIKRGSPVENCDAPALASDNRTFSEVVRLQGLPDDFDLPPFKVKEKVRAVGNGVPLQIGLALSRAVIAAYSSVTDQSHRCACGCGRPVTGKQVYVSSACRKRAQRKRDAAQPGASQV